jgi:hypothetical protein
MDCWQLQMLSDPSCAHELDIEESATATLSTAVGLARAGDCQRARELCASVIFEIQPLMAARRDLLRITLYALLVARGFKLLSRFVRAMSGSDIQMVLLPGGVGTAAPQFRGEQQGRTIYAVDPGWLARLSPEDDFLQRWTDALADGCCSYPDKTVAKAPEYTLQPALVGALSNPAATTGVPAIRQSQLSVA